MTGTDDNMEFRKTAPKAKLVPNSKLRLQEQVREVMRNGRRRQDSKKTPGDETFAVRFTSETANAETTRNQQLEF